MKDTTKNISIADAMPKRTHRVFVRESGPDAWGAGIRVRTGCLARRGRGNTEWFLITEDTTLYMEYEDSYLEVYTPGETELDVYEAYGD